MLGFHAFLSKLVYVRLCQLSGGGGEVLINKRFIYEENMYLIISLIEYHTTS